MLHTYILFIYHQLYINLAADGVVNWNTGNSNKRQALETAIPMCSTSCASTDHTSATSGTPAHLASKSTSRIWNLRFRSRFIFSLSSLSSSSFYPYFMSFFFFKPNSCNRIRALIPQFSYTFSIIFPYYWFESRIELFYIHWNIFNLSFASLWSIHNTVHPS
jgi:hypothetical protein